MDKNTQNKYVEVIKGAKEDFEKLKKNFSNANIAVLESETIAEKLKVEITKLKTHLKSMEKKVKASNDVKPAELRALAELNAEAVGFDKILADSITRDKKFDKPLDNFETFEKELDKLEEDVQKDSDLKEIGKKMEEIFSYSTKCINFIDFYNHHKAKLNELYEILKAKNEELSNIKTADGWIGWFKKFTPYVLPLVMAALTKAVSFYTGKYLSDVYGASY